MTISCGTWYMPIFLVRSGGLEVAPVKGEPFKGEAVKVEPVDAGPVKGEAVKVEPVDAGPVKGEAVKVEPVDAGPVEVEQVEVSHLFNQTDTLSVLLIMLSRLVCERESIRCRFPDSESAILFGLVCIKVGPEMILGGFNFRFLSVPGSMIV